MDLTALTKKIQQLNYAEMQAGNFNLLDVFRLGETMAKRVGLMPSNNPAQDVWDIVRQNGGRIHYIDFSYFQRHWQTKDPILENSIYVHEENDFDIILPAHAPYAEHRYTISHELGHYVLHANSKCYARRHGNTRIEQEATHFSLGFLMPSINFEHAYIQTNGNIFDLSLTFFVPVEVMKLRINLHKQQ